MTRPEDNLPDGERLISTFFFLLALKATLFIVVLVILGWLLGGR